MPNINRKSCKRKVTVSFMVSLLKITAKIFSKFSTEINLSTLIDMTQKAVKGVHIFMYKEIKNRVAWIYSYKSTGTYSKQRLGIILGLKYFMKRWWAWGLIFPIFLYILNSFLILDFFCFVSSLFLSSCYLITIFPPLMLQYSSLFFICYFPLQSFHP